MKRLVIVAMVLSAVTLVATPSIAGVIWYNGDFDHASGLANEINTFVSDARVYDDFVLSAPATVGAVFSNNLMNFTGVTQAFWEIRSGVSAGNGGTVVASGTSAATQSATGASGFGLVEYTIRVGGLSVNLASGTYWLAVAPLGTGGDGGDLSYISTTSGLNAIGLPAGNNANAFFDSAYFGNNFSSTTASFGSEHHDYSMGVESQVPEPGTLLLLGAGLTALRARRGRRS